MDCSSSEKRQRKHFLRRTSAGFSTLELLVVVAIGIVTTAIAIPMVQNSLRYYALREATSAVTGAIQANRYNAIFHGCQYQVVFTAATNSYTVATTADPAGGGSCLTALGTPSAAVPLPGTTQGVSLGGNYTLVFYASGKVTAPASMTLSIPSTSFTPETITVSNYGSVNVTP
jgi:type II secretory pathway pseudopilin PulG